MRALIKNLIRFLAKQAGHSLVLRSLIAFLFYVFAFKILRVDKRKTNDAFIDRFMVVMGATMLTYGFKDLALRTYLAFLKTNGAYNPREISVANQLAITQFLKGHYKECLQTFRNKQKALDEIIALFNLEDVNVEFLDDSWTLAIGHIAHLDTYFKNKILSGKKCKTIIFDKFGSLPDGFPIIKFYTKSGLKMLTAGSKEERLQLASKEVDRAIGEGQFLALQQSFWYGTHSKKIELFGKYGAMVQKEWYEAGKKPLARSTTAQYGQFRDEMFELFGLPKEAWFVTLHVREPGYHQNWHNTHPTTRNATIASYDKVIQVITSSGGWVIRAGDPSMQPLPEQANVIDYAVSPQRCPTRDIQLCEFCRFFIGTNSGFSLVPGIFGTPSLLSNWSPIAIPNWFPFDIMIPKKVWSQTDKRYLSADEMLANFTGWTQFKKDFTGTKFILEDNTPEELMHATIEMLERTSANEKKAQNHAKTIAQQAYQRLIEEKCGYAGAEISNSFIRDNPWFIEDIDGSSFPAQCVNA